MNETSAATGAFDRVTDRAASAARHPSERVSAAADAIDAGTDLLRATRNEWVEGARAALRGHPFGSVAAAIVLGTVIARITRRSSRA